MYICIYHTIYYVCIRYSKNKFRNTFGKKERRGAASRQVVGALCAADWITNSFAFFSQLMSELFADGPTMGPGTIAQVGYH